MSKNLISSLLPLAILAISVLVVVLSIFLIPKIAKLDKSHRLTDKELSLAFWIPAVFFILACPILFNLERSGVFEDIPGIYFSCVSGPSLFILGLFALIKIIKAKSIRERILTIFALIAILVSGVFSLGLYIMIFNHMPLLSM